ncbi:hypothetical protein CLIB1423_17S01310 [[Candida] railenensis]|uniref:Hyphally-regulated cell wall protein N-terminal domain-containing protein n=1 Tax=[Candida] railenensis TaxID=45579 RepID=A0A9P0QT66_9ASCO|nr:hypothetical protein CLIB1423_17S01310 [[Candida] railenensis]
MYLFKTFVCFTFAIAVVNGDSTNSSSLLDKISADFGSSPEDYSYFPATNIGSNSGFLNEHAGQLIFQTEDELFDSIFWRELQRKKNPQRAGRFVLKIEETGSVYHFGESEMQLPTGQSFLPEWIYKPRRDIELLEVDYGEGVKLDALNIPVSYCKSAELTSGSGSTVLSTTIGHTISIGISRWVRWGVVIAGISLNTGIDTVDISVSNSFSISCTYPQGNRLQVFAKINYISFPNARMRKVAYRSNSNSFESEEMWERIISSDGKYEEYGLVLFANVAHPPTLECVNFEADLRCESFVDLANDPLSALDYVV